MSLTSYIENLRKRPEHVRRRVAFGWSAGASIVIFVFWISSFTSIGIGGPIGGSINVAKKSAVATASKVVSPGESLVAGVGSFANDVWSMIVAPKKVTYSVIEVLPGEK
ncbi:MAG: hypothetical protein NT077_02515 [Candidatus Taylorbacteria bacterium]|nr:hypothetical protein [Candidatus Taylorbacteria bacterium]